MSARRLIVSADDFGMAPGVDAGIAAAVAAGAVTSVGVMANLADPARLRALRMAQPEVSLGVHLNLTTGVPVAGASAVPTLVGADGGFLPLAVLTRRTLAGRVRRADVERELRAQVDRLQAAGVPLDHFDSHQHVHLLPGVLAAVVALARATGIRRLRSHLPRLVGPGGAAARLAYYRRHPRRVATHVVKRLLAFRLRAAGLLLPDGMVSGALLLGRGAGDPLAEWDALCAGLPAGIWELVVHPADLDVPGTRELPALGALVERRAAELAALTSPAFRALCARHGVARVPFAAVAEPAARVPAAPALRRNDVA
jgi:chitin disaccharide deacetylase